MNALLNKTRHLVRRYVPSPINNFLGDGLEIFRNWCAPRSRKLPGRIDLDNVHLDLSSYWKIAQMCERAEGRNAGCRLHPHWIRMNRKDFSRLRKTRRLEALHWVGGGYPRSTQLRNMMRDVCGISQFFANRETLDIESGLYQFYRIRDIFNLQSCDFDNLGRIRVVEIGGGYGRLALTFLAYFGDKCNWVSIDYAPTSLTVAPQVVRQCFPELKIADVLQFERTRSVEEFNFVSLGAWQVDALVPGSFDLAVNIHSFQEMYKDSYLFYVNLAQSLLVRKGICYIVNNPPQMESADNYRGHEEYGLEAYFEEMDRTVNIFTVDLVKIYGVPSLERRLVRKN